MSYLADLNIQTSAYFITRAPKRAMIFQQFSQHSRNQLKVFNCTDCLSESKTCQVGRV